MSAATESLLSQRLTGRLAPFGQGPWQVAFSGGRDSTALLHALSLLPAVRAAGLRAIHVDHGLHPASAEWSTQCQALCDRLALPLTVCRVQVDRTSDLGVEGAARQARYRAFADALVDGETLLLAHHREDQAETVLLKLLRGAGPEGLAGMRAQRPLGRGRLARPLLELPQALLHQHVVQHGLPFVQDPSNEDRALARNWLRHDILPRLQRHWPQAVDSIVHSARLSRQADDALRAQWLEHYRQLVDPIERSLQAEPWLALPAGLRWPLLDHWLHQLGLRAPTHAQRQQIEQQQRCAAAERVPCVRWPGTLLHLWRGRWWATPLLPTPATDWQACWQGEPLDLPGGGVLGLRDVHGQPARLDHPLQVRLRRGGERLRPLGHAHTRELRDLFQQGGLPPWLRPLCPLIYQDDQLLAVADRWLAAPLAERLAEHALRLYWQPFPIDSQGPVQ